MLFTNGVRLTEANHQRARASGITLLNELDLEYFEKLVDHLGEAARYQFLATVFPGKQVPGLSLEVPALRSKAGRYTAFTFSVRPSYLLKIAFVSHRARGGSASLTAYQRMISGSRLKAIRAYIQQRGIFPTNIVINLIGNHRTRFDPGPQTEQSSGTRFGTLRLRTQYGSAWIVDGQHRLFAYSGHPRAASSFLTVVAFENLPESEQAHMFVDINHGQKRVKQSLLDELSSQLYWDADDEETRLKAIKSRAILTLNQRPEGPFENRILLGDATRTTQTCISISSIMRALDSTAFYMSHPRPGISKPQALFDSDRERAVQRTVDVLTCWFEHLQIHAMDWWEAGAARDGGGLAMNDGVTVAIWVLRSVLAELSSQCDLSSLTTGCSHK